MINRGNYRRDVFETEGASHSFVEGLSEAVKRHGWRLQAYVLMRNHFHLVLETPEPTLMAGMKWSLGAYNPAVQCAAPDAGHLVRGRYKSLLVDGSEDLYL